MPVEDRREAIFPDAVGLGWDVRHRAALLDQPAQDIAIIALVREQGGVGKRRQYSSGGAGPIDAGPETSLARVAEVDCGCSRDQIQFEVRSGRIEPTGT